MFKQGCIVVWAVRFEKNRGGFILKDLRFVNGNCVEELTGYTKSEFLKNPRLLLDVIYPEDRGVIVRLREGVSRGEHVEFETRLRRRDGVCISVKHLVVPDENRGKVVEAIYIVRSLSAEEREGEGKYQELFERMVQYLPAGVFLYRDRIVFANRAYEEITGYSLSELRGMHIWDIFADEEQRESIRSVAEKRIRCEGTPMVYKHAPFYMRDGSLRYLDVYTDTLELVDGCGGFGIAIDVTEERVLRDKLEEESLLLNVLTEESPALVMIYGERPVYANRVFHELLGYTPKELSERYVWELISEDLRDTVRESIERRLSGDNFTSFYPKAKFITKSGDFRYIDVVSSTVRYSGRSLGILVGIDSTSEHEKEEALRNLNDMYVILSNINQAIVRISREDEILKSACESFVGGSRFKATGVWLLDETEGEVYPEYVCGETKCTVFTERLPLPGEVDSREMHPLIRCISKGAIIINNNTIRNAHLGSWRAPLLAKGFASSAFIPLKKKGKTVGVLGVFADKPFVFDRDVYLLLKEVAQDISFALDSIEKERWLSVFNSVLEYGTDWVVITDKDGTIVYANRAVEKISGYKRGEILGKNPRVFKSGVHDKQFYENLWSTILSGGVFSSIVVNRAKNGELFRLNKTITPVFMNGEIQYFVSVDKDITHEKKLEELIYRLSTIDPVTHLPNRKSFIEQASGFFEEMKLKDSIAAVVIVSPSGISEINQVFSFEEGDKVLRKIGAVLRKTVRNYDLVAKLVGDRFAVLLKDLKTKEDILSIVNKIKQVLFSEVDIGRDVKLSYNIGISVYPDDGTDVRDLLSKAEVAVSYARKSGENIHAFFQKDLGEEITRAFNVRVELSRAIKDEEFALFYQPYFDALTGELRGAEVLLRWNRRDSGLVPPSEFIPVLEQTNMIVDVEKWLVERVCMNITKWRSLGVSVVPLSINVSPQSFSMGSIEKEILSAIDKHSVDPSLLTVEIVERMFIDNLERARETLLRLKDIQVAVAIDDFGTGYSSLSYLKVLPVDILKIDISFIRELTEDAETLAIVDAIINLANKLNMSTIAEGVETQQQLSLLRDLRCTMVQGFLFSKPLPEMDFLKMLLRNSHV